MRENRCAVKYCEKLLNFESQEMQLHQRNNYNYCLCCIRPKEIKQTTEQQEKTRKLISICMTCIRSVARIFTYSLKIEHFIRNF